MEITTEHSRIIFNGDNYTDQWVAEAEKRKLPNIRSTVGSLATIMDEENVSVFERHGVLSREELHARTEILLEAYSMQINIEATTMLSIVKRQILPAVVKYSELLGNAVGAVKNAGVDSKVQVGMLEKVCSLMKSLQNGVDNLEKVVTSAGGTEDVVARAEDYRDNVIPAMQAVRQASDGLETIVDADIWPLPTYAEMLFLK
jgi:glutamine synthetase